jgi:hypothetical protein
MRLTVKDPARRLDNAAEVAVWAGLLRDGVGVAAGWLRRRTVVAYACVALTALVVIALVSVIGFASTPGPVTASPVSPRSAQGGVAAPPGRSPVTGAVTSPGRPPAAGPVTQRESGGVVPDAEAVNSVHGRGYGRYNGGGHPNGPGEGNGNGQDKDNGNGHGD